jgi:hypothetical protein
MSSFPANVIADITPKPSENFDHAKHTPKPIHEEIYSEAPRRSKRPRTIKSFGDDFTVYYWDMFSQHERWEEKEKEKEKEREMTMQEQMSKWCGPSSPKPLGSIYRGGGDGCFYLLFHWWGKILQVCHQIFTTKFLEAAIKSLYL